MKFPEKVIVFARLHFLQMLWNFKGMQHFGFLFALRPVLRRLFSGDDYLAAEKRQGLFFNTHPYFAPICAGVVVKLEEQLKSGEFTKPEMIPVLKNRMSGPLAAVGDAFFWETVRPVIASLCVFAVYAFGTGSMAAINSVFMLVLVYVGLVELMRWQSLGWGYRHGLSVIEILKKKDFHGSMRRIRNIGALVLGIATVFFIAERIPAGPIDPIARVVALGTLLAGTARKISPTVLLYVLVIAGTIFGSRL